MPEIQTKDKLITLEELGAAIDAKAGVTSVNSQTGAVSLTPANIGAVNKAGDTMTGTLTAPNFIGSINGYKWDFFTDNTTDSYTLVLDTNNNIQHRVLPSWLNYINTIPVDRGGTGTTGVSGSASELTAGQNIALINTSVRKWGKISVLTLFFEVTAQINSYAPIFTATSAYKADSEYNSYVCDLSGKCYPVYYNTDGILRPRVVMPAGYYYGNLSFCVL